MAKCPEKRTVPPRVNPLRLFLLAKQARHFVIMVLLFFLFFLRPTFSQDSLLIRGETKLSTLFRQMHQTPNDSTLIHVNDMATNLFQRILQDPGSFTYPFDSLRHTGKLFPPDTSFRLINWNLTFSDGHYHYDGFILLKDSLNRTSRVIRLEDHSEEIPHPEDTLLTPSCWYGALYYDILLNTWEGKKYYTVLGIDFHDPFITKKIIDVITIDKEHQVAFGAPVFSTGKGIHQRILFAFTAQASMLLHYDTRLHMIVFDHLSPSRPQYQGLYQFYGPDFSYDGFAFYHGMWHLKKDLDLRNIR